MSCVAAENCGVYRLAPCGIEEFIDGAGEGKAALAGAPMAAIGAAAGIVVEDDGDGIAGDCGRFVGGGPISEWSSPAMFVAIIDRFGLFGMSDRRH